MPSASVVAAGRGTRLGRGSDPVSGILFHTVMIVTTHRLVDRTMSRDDRLMTQDVLSLRGQALLGARVYSAAARTIDRSNREA